MVESQATPRPSHTSLEAPFSKGQATPVGPATRLFGPTTMFLTFHNSNLLILIFTQTEERAGEEYAGLHRM